MNAARLLLSAIASLLVTMNGFAADASAFANNVQPYLKEVEFVEEGKAVVDAGHGKGGESSEVGLETCAEKRSARNLGRALCVRRRLSRRRRGRSRWA